MSDKQTVFIYMIPKSRYAEVMGLVSEMTRYCGHGVNKVIEHDDAYETHLYLPQNGESVLHAIEKLLTDPDITEQWEYQVGRGFIRSFLYEIRRGATDCNVRLHTTDDGGFLVRRFTLRATGTKANCERYDQFLNSLKVVSVVT
jgi:hypothetical protein